MAARPILVNLITAVNGKGIEDAQKKLSGLGGTLDKLSSKAIKAGGAFVAFQGGRVFADFATEATVQARDLERNVIALDTVFGEYSETMRGFGASAQQFGLSQSESAKASVFLGSVLKQSGFSMDEVAEQTQRLVELGADLSITYGYDVQEALLGMTALFRGEYDPIEKFGVAMKQSEINAALAAAELDHLEGSERRLAEQQIRLQLLFERSTDAQGAFARGTGTLFAEQQKLEAAINNMLQQAGTPLLKTMADLAAAMTPLVEEITPTLVAQFERFIPAGTSADEVAQELVGTIKNLIDNLGATAEAVIKITIAIADNIEAIVRFIAAIALVRGLDKVFMFISTAVVTLTANMKLAEVGAKNLRLALLRTGVGIVAIAVAELVTALTLFNERATENNTEVAKQAKALETYATSLRYASASNNSMRMSGEKLNPAIQALGTSSRFAAGEMRRFEDIKLERLRAAFAGINFELNRVDTSSLAGILKASGLTREDLKPKTPEVVEAARDFVKEFFEKVEDEAAKVAATAKLESLGASPALIQSIINFGEGWEKVFENIVRGGSTAVQELQDLFDTTSAGIEELTKIQEDFDKKVKEAADNRFARLQDEYDQAVEFANKMQEAASEAKDAFSDFFSAFDILPTVSNDIGKFEQQTINALASINDELERTLESFITEGGDSLFQTAYDNLKAYADKEMQELRRIQRDRDELAKRRSIIESITEEVMQAGNVVGLLADINQKLENNKDKTTKVIQDTVTAGKRLQDFRVSIITNLVDPLESVGSKADMLVDSYKAVVDRTRTFVENLKALQKLGLDPQLFNQIVEAGVAAGGETAQALVDGGSKTIQEINGLTRELNELGAQIGVETADVMYSTGETFINSILAGIQSQQSALEAEARALAQAFSDSFKADLDLAVGSIAAEAAVAIPEVPSLPQVVKDVSKELNQLGALQTAAREFGASTKNATFALGAAAKEEIYEVLENALLAGADVDISGISSGMSTADLLAAAQAAAPTVVFNIGEINADSRAGGRSASEALITTINNTVQRNGSIATLVSGTGQVAL